MKNFELENRIEKKFNSIDIDIETIYTLLAGIQGQIHTVRYLNSLRTDLYYKEVSQE